MLISILISLFVLVILIWLFWDIAKSEPEIVFVPFVLAGLTFMLFYAIICFNQHFKPKITQADSYKIVVWNDGKKEHSMLLPATNSLYYVPESLLEVDGHGNLRMKE